jgi:hypothetical protein
MPPAFNINNRLWNTFRKFREERENHMDSTILIRVIAGVLFAVVLGVLVQRRRTRVK